MNSELDQIQAQAARLGLSVEEYNRLCDSDCDGDSLRLLRLLGNAARREEAEEAVEFFKSKGVYVEGDSTILISFGGKFFYFWPKSGKWRTKGKAKVYRSAGWENFMEILERNNQTFSQQAFSQEICKFDSKTLSVDTIYKVISQSKAGKYETITLDNGLRYWQGYGNEHLKVDDQFIIVPFCVIKSQAEYIRAEKC